MDQLPAESLSQVFAFLDPVELRRAAQCSRRCLVAAQDANLLWKAEASRRFGAEWLPSQVRDWAMYCWRRQSHFVPPQRYSPLMLIQEEFMHDPFQVLAACILTARTSGSELCHAAIRSVLELCPTPRSFVCMSDETRARLLVLVDPLGLQERRVAALARMAQGYVGEDWQDPMESLYGIGPFGTESYRIFTGNETPVHQKKFGSVVTDPSVRGYAHWVQSFSPSQSQDARAEDGGSRGPSRQPRSLAAKAASASSSRSLASKAATKEARAARARRALERALRRDSGVSSPAARTRSRSRGASASPAATVVTGCGKRRAPADGGAAGSGRDEPPAKRIR